jgi:transcriptional regulator with XRE-family HTH domain
MAGWWRTVGFLEDPRVTFGENVRAAREELEWTQVDVAKAINEFEPFDRWLQTIVDKVETADRPTSVEEVMALAYVLEVPPETLLSEVPPGQARIRRLEAQVHRHEGVRDSEELAIRRLRDQMDNEKKKERNR